MATLPVRRTVATREVPRPAGTPTSERRSSEGPSRTVRLVTVVLAFLAVSLLALLLVNLGAAFADPPPSAAAATPIPEPFAWLRPWVRFDSGWYYSIATNGYSYTPGQQSSVAFFPTYPLLMDLVDPVLGTYLAGVLLTVLAGLGFALLFARWCSARMSRSAAITALALLLLYPYSFYLYGAVYADAVFVLCALGAFVLLERGHPVLAGLVGALATAGRPVGIAVAIGLTVRAVELAARRAAADGRAGPPEAGGEPGAATEPVTGWSGRLQASTASAVGALRQTRWSDGGVLLAFAGLAGYLAYQWAEFGTPVAFIATESAPGWDQGTGPRVWLKQAFVGTLLRGDPDESARLLLPALLCLGTILLLPRIQRRFGWGYAVLTAIVVAIPVIGTKDFMGSGRYLLAAFPAFAAAGELLAERWPRRARLLVLPLSAVLLVIAATAYGYGYEVS